MALPLVTPLGAAGGGDMPGVHVDPTTGVARQSMTTTSPAATNAQAEAKNSAAMAAAGTTSATKLTTSVTGGTGDAPPITSVAIPTVSTPVVATTTPSAVTGGGGQATAQKTILRGKRGNAARRQAQTETAVFDALPAQTQCMLRVEQIQQQMCQNIIRAFEQQQLLEDLDERAAFLENQSKQFKQTATALRKRFWWQDAKWTITLMLLLGLFLLGFFVYVSKGT